MATVVVVVGVVVAVLASEAVVVLVEVVDSVDLGVVVVETSDGGAGNNKIVGFLTSLSSQGGECLAIFVGFVSSLL